MSGIQSFIQSDQNSLPAILEQIDRVISWSVQQNHAVGYFAVLYYQMLRSVDAESEWGRFGNKEIVRELNLKLANQYLKTLYAYFQDDVLPGCWQLSLTSAGNEQVSLFQHLVINLHSHLEYDLPVNASQIIDAGQVESFKEDYFTYILLYVEQLSRVQAELGKRSKAFRMMSAFGSAHDQWIADLSRPDVHRSGFETLLQLTRADDATRVDLIDQIDVATTNNIESVVSGAFKPRRRLVSRVSRWESQSAGKMILELKSLLK